MPDRPLSHLPVGRHSADAPQVVSDATPEEVLPRRNRRRGRRVLIAAGVAFLAVAGTAGGYTTYLTSQISHLDVGGLAAAGGSDGTENILLVGSTSRCALKVQNPAYGLCSQGVNGVNSDVVMVLHLNATAHTVSVLSIPRDTFVPNARSGGANKIDAALAEGPTQLVAAIRQDFGISIQHYIQLNFETFANVVDALGGVKMFFPEPVYDAFSGLNVSAAGCRTLDGIHALQVVRTRHLQHRGTSTSARSTGWSTETESDLARIRRNHEFLRVMATAVAQQGLDNPITDERIVGAIASKLEVDKTLSAAHLASLALTFHNVNINSAPQMTLPIIATTFGSYHYKGGDYGDIVWPSQPQDSAVIRQFLGLPANVNTLTGQPLPSPSTINVAVLNGTGIPGEGATASASLTAAGFIVMSTGATASVARQSETVVYASPDNVGAAQAVLQRLSGHAVLGNNPSFAMEGAAVTVVTGTGFALDVPAGTAVSSPSAVAVPAPTALPLASPISGATHHRRRRGTAPLPSATVSVEPSAASSTAPSAASEGLAPWDPRSCGPDGTVGP